MHNPSGFCCQSVWILVTFSAINFITQPYLFGFVLAFGSTVNQHHLSLPKAISSPSYSSINLSSYPKDVKHRDNGIVTFPLLKGVVHSYERSWVLPRVSMKEGTHRGVLEGGAKSKKKSWFSFGFPVQFLFKKMTRLLIIPYSGFVLKRQDVKFFKMPWNNYILMAWKVCSIWEPLIS